MIRHPKNRRVWNRKNTYNLLVAFDKILEKLELSQVDFNIFMPHLVNWYKIRDNNFNCLYIEDYELKNIAHFTTIEKIDNIWKYVRKRITKPLRTRKILWLTYKNFLEEWFIEVEDISYENIILRQIFELCWHPDIKKSHPMWIETQKFIIPKKFVHNQYLYNISYS